MSIHRRRLIDRFRVTSVTGSSWTHTACRKSQSSTLSNRSSLIHRTSVMQAIADVEWRFKANIREAR